MILLATAGADTNHAVAAAGPAAQGLPPRRERLGPGLPLHLLALVLDTPALLRQTRSAAEGNAEAGYVLAEAALPAGKCDLVAEASAALPGKSAVASESFNTALAALRSQHATLTIDVAQAQGEAPGRPYPETKGGERASTAGEWNAIAAANNRVEIRWHPAP